MPVIVAPSLSVNVAQSATATITPAITSNGSLVVPTSLTVLSQPANGTATVSGVNFVYTPNAAFYGQDSFTYKATVAGTDSNVATITGLVNATASGDLGRVTRSFSSGYTASRREVHRIRRFAQRAVTANFNGRSEEHTSELQSPKDLVC